MKKFKIIVSKANIYTGQVEKLKNESKLQTEVIYIEDLVDIDKVFPDFENSIIYFLCCNSPLIPIVIKKLEKYNSYIINKEYLIKNYSKLDVQHMLYDNNVNVPKIYYTENFENIKFPIFCKENKHEGIIIQAYNKISLIRFFEKFNAKAFYMEQVIKNNGLNPKEFKVYFVEGKVFLKDMTNYNKILIRICKQISLVLNNLEVFSADIIQNLDGEFFIIDVNPSAGFYLSDDGRKKFLEELIKK